MSSSTRQIQLPRIQTRKSTVPSVNIQMNTNTAGGRQTRASARKAGQKEREDHSERQIAINSSPPDESTQEKLNQYIADTEASLLSKQHDSDDGDGYSQNEMSQWKFLHLAQSQSGSQSGSSLNTPPPETPIAQSTPSKRVTRSRASQVATPSSDNNENNIHSDDSLHITPAQQNKTPAKKKKKRNKRKKNGANPSQEDLEEKSNNSDKEDKNMPSSDNETTNVPSSDNISSSNNNNKDGLESIDSSPIEPYNKINFVGTDHISSSNNNNTDNNDKGDEILPVDPDATQILSQPKDSIDESEATQNNILAIINRSLPSSEIEPTQLVNISLSIDNEKVNNNTNRDEIEDEIEESNVIIDSKNNKEDENKGDKEEDNDEKEEKSVGSDDTDDRLPSQPSSWKDAIVDANMVPNVEGSFHVEGMAEDEKNSDAESDEIRSQASVRKNNQEKDEKGEKNDKKDDSSVEEVEKPATKKSTKKKKGTSASKKRNSKSKASEKEENADKNKDEESKDNDKRDKDESDLESKDIEKSSQKSNSSLKERGKSKSGRQSRSRSKANAEEKSKKSKSRDKSKSRSRSRSRSRSQSRSRSVREKNAKKSKEEGEDNSSSSESEEENNKNNQNKRPVPNKNVFDFDETDDIAVMSPSKRATPKSPTKTKEKLKSSSTPKNTKEKENKKKSKKTEIEEITDSDMVESEQIVNSQAPETSNNNKADDENKNKRGKKRKRNEKESTDEEEAQKAKKKAKTTKSKKGENNNNNNNNKNNKGSSQEKKDDEENDFKTPKQAKKRKREDDKSSQKNKKQKGDESSSEESQSILVDQKWRMWSPREKLKLIDLVVDQVPTSADDWEAIASTLQRSADSVRKKFTSLKNDGVFSPKKKKKVITSGTFRKDGIWRSTTGYANMLLAAFKHLPSNMGTLDEICDYVEENYANELNYELVPGRANQTKWRKAMTNILRKDHRFFKNAEGEYTVVSHIKDELERLTGEDAKDPKK